MNRPTLGMASFIVVAEYLYCCHGKINAMVLIQLCILGSPLTPVASTWFPVPFLFLGARLQLVVKTNKHLVFKMDDVTSGTICMPL